MPKPPKQSKVITTKDLKAPLRYTARSIKAQLEGMKPSPPPFTTYSKPGRGVKGESSN